MNVIITIPKSIKWEDYLKEIKTVENGTQEMNYKVPTCPKDVNPGDKCYLVYDGYIRGWMTISNVGKKNEFNCTTTGSYWKEGYYISRTGKFHYLKNPIPMKGFMGYRKTELNVEQ